MGGGSLLAVGEGGGGRVSLVWVGEGCGGEDFSFVYGGEERERYFFDDGFKVLAFSGGGAGFCAEGGEVGEDFVVAEDGGLGFEDLGCDGMVS